MPELPEVETTVRDLRKKLVGLKFTDIWTDWPKSFAKAGGFDNFKKTIKNRKILSVRRRAKFIVIDIDGAYSIFIHQKISGHLLYGHWMPEVPSSKSQVPNKLQILKNLEKIQKWIPADKGPLKNDPKNRFIRTLFFLSNGYQLAFSDLRRFGKIMLVEDPERSRGRDKLRPTSYGASEIEKLGPEPLEINFTEFKKLFEKKKGRIKQVLMDPFFIVGIGNIYSDEILWDSDYHPLSRVENLKESDLKKIYNSTQKILKKAIKAGGTSIEDYRKVSGEKGEYQDYTEAYHQHGDKCSKKDGGVIKRIKVGGRSAHFCPKHQKLK